ncbi:MAG: ABC transporter ATP-binding protein [Methylococcales bacterium]|jgi:ABC-2 type transport system ATP-binding protein|nr:ABC transporter ATP-binding protein [Methylococcales bacterium]
MIKVNNLVFEYPGKRVLHNLSFSISAQRICALVGPNGAGKTTLLRCIAALDRPFSGRIDVAGIDVHQSPRLSHKNIGYLADFFGLYERLTVVQSLKYMTNAYGIAPSQQKEAINWVIERLGLTEHKHKKAEQLSRGLRQRLGIAKAMIHKPELLILDEPASGLDPEARHDLSELMVELKNAGMTLLVSSHILAELEEYSDEMLIIRDGKIVDHQQQIQSSDKDDVMVQITTLTRSNDIYQYLSRQQKCTQIEVNDQTIHFCTPADDHYLHELMVTLLNMKFPIVEFFKVQHTMQHNYLQSVKRGDK